MITLNFFVVLLKNRLHNDLVLIVNVEKSECHLDDKVFVSTSNVGQDLNV